MIKCFCIECIADLHAAVQYVIKYKKYSCSCYKACKYAAEKYEPNILLAAFFILDIECSPIKTSFLLLCY